MRKALAHPYDKGPDGDTDEQTERSSAGQRPSDGDEHTGTDGSGDGDKLDMVRSKAPGCQRVALSKHGVRRVVGLLTGEQGWQW